MSGEMKRQNGSVILLVLLVGAVFAVLAPVAGTIATSEARIARSHAVQNAALYIAEAGVELALARLRAQPGFTGGISGELNGGSYTVSVSGGTAPLAERTITSTGRWGGGQQQAAARVTFSQAPLQDFLFRHTFLSGGTVDIRDVIIRGPFRVGAIGKQQGTNTFQNLTGQPLPPDERPVLDSEIPPVNFSHYQALATAHPTLWLNTPSPDLDGAIRDAIRDNRRRILVRAGNADVTLCSPVNFSGLIVIQAREVRFRYNINAGRSEPLVILTTGRVDSGPGGGSSAETLGRNTLLYSNETVSLTRSGGASSFAMDGIVVAKKGGANPRDLWNANLTYNNAMLHLLAQDAQPNFRQQGETTQQSVVYIRP